MEAIIHGTCCTPTAGSSTVRGRGGRLMASRAKRTSVYRPVSMQLSSDAEKEKSFTFSPRGVRLPICICGGARTRADWCAGVGVKINDLWQVSWLPLLAKGKRTGCRAAQGSRRIRRRNGCSSCYRFWVEAWKKS